MPRARDQLVARLVDRHPPRVSGDGSVWVEFEDAGRGDERVPAAYFAELRDAGLVEELAAGEWVLGTKGRRRLSGQAPPSPATAGGPTVRDMEPAELTPAQAAAVGAAVARQLANPRAAAGADGAAGLPAGGPAVPRDLRGVAGGAQTAGQAASPQLRPGVGRVTAGARPAGTSG